MGYEPVHDSEHVTYRLLAPAQSPVGGRSQLYLGAGEGPCGLFNPSARGAARGPFAPNRANAVCGRLPALERSFDPNGLLRPLHLQIEVGGGMKGAAREAQRDWECEAWRGACILYYYADTCILLRGNVYTTTYTIPSNNTVRHGTGLVTALGPPEAGPPTAPAARARTAPTPPSSRAYIYDTYYNRALHNN